MARRCAERVLARSLARSPRQEILVDELLTQGYIPIRVGSDGIGRVGNSGMRLEFADYIIAALRNNGFRVTCSHGPTQTGENEYLRLTFPGGYENGTT